MRFSSIDVLRTLSILIMIVVHFCENLAGVTPLIAGIGAPMFMFLSGVSYRLWLNGRQTKQLSRDMVSKITVRRGLFLIGLGFAFNILIWLPEDVFNWDVLTLIGTGILCLGAARQAPSPLIWLTCGMIFLLSPVARHLAGWESYWTDDYFDPDFTLHDVLQGYFAVGYFPLFPWLLYPLLGFSVATEAFGGIEQPQPHALRRAGMVGAALMVVSATTVTLRVWRPELFPANWPASWTMFPASAEYVLGTAGWVLFAFSTSYWLLDVRMSVDRWRWLRQVTERFSRRSLTAYLLHHAVHVWPLWIYAVAQGLETTHYWRQATDLPTALGLAALFTVACYVFFTWLDRRKYPTVENLMRWVCD